MMTDHEFILSLQSQIEDHLAGAPPDPDDTDSPTGRKPLLVWTPALQKAYNQMVADYEATTGSLGAQWCDLIFDNAKGNRYGDSGLWATIAYQMTGDPQWVEYAWSKIEAMLASSLDDDNNTRELAAERVIMLDWLWPGLTEDRREQYLEALDRMFTNADLAAVRLNDSDQATGVYFGVVLYMLGFGDLHPPANDFYATPCVGGLDSTKRDRTTMRNAVLDFVMMAEGGEWIESQEYNLGTVRHLVLGAYAVQVATGADHFPEITAWLPQAALKYPLMLTPNLRGSFQWGDEQYPHQLNVWMWVCTAMMFDDPAARQTVYDLVEQFGPRGSYSAEPTVARSFLRFDPYGPQAHTEQTLLNGSGQGIIAGRSAHGSMFCGHIPPTWPIGTVDHAVSYFADLQFYRGNGWGLTHPLTYSGVGLNGEGTNGMLHRGIGQPKECRVSVKAYAGADWLYAAGTSGGTILASKFYQPPPTFWYEWSRSYLWIHGDVDTIIVFDRSNLDDPLVLAGCSKYPDDIEKKFNKSPLRQWRWHCPVAPTLGSNSAAWPIAEGEACRLTWLRDDLTPTVVDQKVEWAGYSMAESEKKFHLNLTPPDVAGFQTLVTVIELGDPDQFATVSKHEDEGQCAIAAILARAGQVTQAALFNTTPGPKLPTYGGASAYHPEIPGILTPLRFREFATPQVGARIWGMETESGVSVYEPT